MAIVLPNLRSLKHEKSAKQKFWQTFSLARNKLSENKNYHHDVECQAQISTTDYIWDTLHGNSKQTSSSVDLLHENCRNVFSKTCVNFGRCYGNKGGRRRLKTFLFYSWWQCPWPPVRFLSLAIYPHCHFTHTTQLICHSPSTPSRIPVSVLSSLPRCFCLQLFYYKHLSWISVYPYSLLLYY